MALFAAILLLSQGYFHGAGALPGLEQVRNVLGLVNARSPGQRGAAELIKHRAKASGPTAADIPEQHALGRVLDDPAPEGAVEEALLALAPDNFGTPDSLKGLPGDPGSISSASKPSVYPGGGVFFGGGGIHGRGSPGDGGGGRDATNPGGDTPDVRATDPVADTPDASITTTAAVPEPQTWALMIVGFGLCGAAFRRRRDDQQVRGCSA